MLVVRLVGLGHQVGVGIWMSWSGIKVPSLPGGVDGRQRQACDVQQMEIPMLKRGKKSSHQVSLARVSTRMGRTDGMAGRESRGRRPSIWRKRSSSASWTGSGAASPSIPGVDLQEQAKIQNIYICVFLDVHLTSCLTSLLYIVGGAAEKVIGPVDEFIGLVTSVIVTTSSLSSSPSRSASPLCSTSRYSASLCHQSSLDVLVRLHLSACPPLADIPVDPSPSTGGPVQRPDTASQTSSSPTSALDLLSPQPDFISLLTAVLIRPASLPPLPPLLSILFFFFFFFFHYPPPPPGRLDRCCACYPCYPSHLSYPHNPRVCPPPTGTSSLPPKALPSPRPHLLPGPSRPQDDEWG